MSRSAGNRSRSSVNPHPSRIAPADVIWRLLALALPLYFVWEMLQMPFFTGMPPDWVVSTLLCAIATLVDGVIIVGLYALGGGCIAAGSGSRRRHGGGTPRSSWPRLW